MKRACGVLLPVSALASKYGIGCFSEEAYRFVDFLVSAGQTYWQVLPLGQTGFGDSPYQSCSVFAGNPYFIDLEKLIERGYLTREEVESCDFGRDPYAVDYEKVYQNRYRLLKEAYHHSPFAPGARVPEDVSEKEKPKEISKEVPEEAPEEVPEDADAAEKKQMTPAQELAAFETFIREQADWLEDYALFCTIKDMQGGKDYHAWRDTLRGHRPHAMAAVKGRYADAFRFWQYVQFEFDRQYMDLKAYANARGIRIIGDMPIYVAADSADVWSHPSLFAVDAAGVPAEVAGCPPDGYAAGGQLWGNPLYDWPEHERTGYAWWIRRLEHSFRYYDVVRIDHFRGFDTYYAIPFGDEDAVNGVWRQGPGMKLFRRINEVLGEEMIIAEDLGFITDSVRQLLSDSGYPGMKVLQFGFDGTDNEYLPHRYVKNCVAYTGTHDNETLAGWYENASAAQREQIERYLGFAPQEGIRDAALRAVMMSQADTVIVPMQDYLGLGNEARMNTPSTLGGRNWSWRVDYWALTEEVSGFMKQMAQTYFRI